MFISRLVQQGSARRTPSSLSIKHKQPDFFAFYVLSNINVTAAFHLREQCQRAASGDYRRVRNRFEMGVIA
jgi:hypothetical protein